MTRPQALTLGICAAIFALGQFHRASGSVYTPILIDRFAVSATLIGALVSAMFLANIAAQLPFGVALDRFGARRVLPGCLALIGAGTALFAVGGTVESLFAARILIGIGSAAMGAASHVIIAHAFPPRDFGMISGMVVTLGGIGGLLGTYPLAFALTRLRWEGVFLGVAGVTLLLAALLPQLIAPQAAPPAAQKGGFRALLAVLHYRRILALSFVTYAPITSIAGLWGGPYLQDALGLSPETAGAVLFALFATTIGGGFVFGLLDRHVTARRRLIAAGVGASIVCLGTLAVWPNPPAIVAVALLIGMVFAQQFYIPLGADMRNTVPEALLGRAAALLALVAVSAIPALQMGFGAVLDITAERGPAVQYRSAFGTMAIIIALCSGVYFWPRRT